MSFRSVIFCTELCILEIIGTSVIHDYIIKWKHFLRYWPFVRGIHRSPVNSPHKDQWRRALMFLWSAPWINGRVNNGEAGDLRRHRTHYDVIVMSHLIGRISLCFTMVLLGQTSGFNSAPTQFSMNDYSWCDRLNFHNKHSPKKWQLIQTDISIGNMELKLYWQIT